MPKRRWSSTWHQFFISSTYKDLIEERQKVTQAILKLYHFPIGMEMFHADNDEQWTQIRFYAILRKRRSADMVERKEYLDQLWVWKDEQQIKVVTGIRRCGKSVLLEQYQQRLLAEGVNYLH